MRTAAIAVVLGGALVGAVVGAVGYTQPTAAGRVPVIVELFTSEGCSSCPPADALLKKLVSSQPVPTAEIIALGEHVDYWDRLGWKDRFSSSQLTNRQQVYGTRFNTESIYTPQMVVDGRAELVGSDAAAARRALDRAAAAPHGTIRVVTEAITRPAVNVSVTASDLPALSRGDRADIVVALTEDGLRSDVTRGENQGHVLAHVAVVRYLATAGEATANGSATTARAEIPIAQEWQREHLNVVAFVQERHGRAILASAVTPVAPR
ncbi:MAG TPA: DUF1223 domain-containing protein [Vicinamibacterales bacterium]|nr:DUF1223 domain-containing protein [Vicinamibacterales bacterium]